MPEACATGLWARLVPTSSTAAVLLGHCFAHISSFACYCHVVSPSAKSLLWENGLAGMTEFTSSVCAFWVTAGAESSHLQPVAASSYLGPSRNVCATCPILSHRCALPACCSYLATSSLALRRDHAELGITMLQACDLLLYCSALALQFGLVIWHACCMYNPARWLLCT